MYTLAQCGLFYVFPSECNPKKTQTFKIFYDFTDCLLIRIQCNFFKKKLFNLVSLLLLYYSHFLKKRQRKSASNRQFIFKCRWLNDMSMYSIHLKPFVLINFTFSLATLNFFLFHSHPFIDTLEWFICSKSSATIISNDPYSKKKKKCAEWITQYMNYSLQRSRKLHICLLSNSTNKR